MNPHDNPDAFDHISLAGSKSPGLVTLSGHGLAEKWDVKDANGQDGSSTTRKGKKLAAFKATFFLTKDPAAAVDDFVAWDFFLPVLKSSTSGEVPVGLDIYHPDLAELEISSVVITKIGGKKHDGKGGATVDVEFLQYRPPKKKKATGPSGSKGTSLTEKAITGGGQPPPDPDKEMKDELAKLQKQKDKLDAGAGDDGQGGGTTLPNGLGGTI
jgi:hypothetical protein